MSKYGYTVVQHSGMGFRQDSTFSKGLQPMPINTAAEVARITKEGGRVFPGYGEADRFCMSEMYPPSVQGLKPEAPGPFSGFKVGELRVYIPLKVPA